MKLSPAHEAIFDRLVEAMETDMALPVQVGPRTFGSSMPEYIHTQSEVFATRREDLTETRGARTREDEKAERRKTQRRARCSPERISRMEETFGWVQETVSNEKYRKCILAYAMVKARGWNWSRYLMARNRRHGKENVWVRQKTYEWIHKSLQAIENKFLHNSDLCVGGVDLQAGQIEANHTGKSITSGLYSWMSPDGKPDQYRKNSQDPQ